MTIATIKSKAKRCPALGVALTGKAARQMERQDRGVTVTHAANGAGEAATSSNARTIKPRRA